MSKEHDYSNGEVTVIWKKDLCIHSRKCWQGLGSVFQPGQRPWIKPDGASTEAIVAQVRQCPSGALTYRMDIAGEAQEPAEANTAPHVEVLPNGPLMVKDRCLVKHSDGRLEERDRTTAFCRCGGSARKPYCDGSHRTNGFSDPSPVV